MIGRDANAKRSSFHSILSTGTLLSVPFPRSEHLGRKEPACVPSSNRRPSTHCDLCGGELRLKLVEPANRTMDLENEIFVCVCCGREMSFVVNHDKYAAH